MSPLELRSGLGAPRDFLGCPLSKDTFFSLIVFFLPRFLFVLLGPEGKAHQYHEIGRSMATIMTDEVREERIPGHFWFSSPLCSSEEEDLLPNCPQLSR